MTPTTRAAVARGDEYLWGRDLLVVPVTEKGATTRKVYLPRGTWYDFWTEEKLEGGREIVRPVDLATMPLFVRAGGILPMGPVKQYTDEPVEGPTTLCVYSGADGHFMLYEDDGSHVRLSQGRLDGHRDGLGRRPAAFDAPARGRIEDEAATDPRFRGPARPREGCPSRSASSGSRSKSDSKNRCNRMR